MYKGLIDNLAFVYAFICKGRGKLSSEDMRGIANGAHKLVKTAPAVLGGEDEKRDDRLDLDEARKMDQHIEEMTIFLLSMEIV